MDLRDLEQEVAVHSHRFPEWENPPEAQDFLSAGEALQLIAALGVALATINTTLINAQAVLRRLEDLYNWAKKAAKPPAAGLSIRERVLVVLFDAQLNAQGPIPVTAVADRVAATPDETRAALSELASQSLATADGADAWSSQLKPG